VLWHAHVGTIRPTTFQYLEITGSRGIQTSGRGRRSLDGHTMVCYASFMVRVAMQHVLWPRCGLVTGRNQRNPIVADPSRPFSYLGLATRTANLLDTATRPAGGAALVAQTSQPPLTGDPLPEIISSGVMSTPFATSNHQKNGNLRTRRRNGPCGRYTMFLCPSDATEVVPPAKGSVYTKSWPGTEAVPLGELAHSR
jgi:hypothetical protein